MGERRGKVPLPGRAAGDTGRTNLAIRRIEAQGTTNIRAGEILTLLRYHDIPCSIDSFSAQGWTAKLGNPAKGFYAQQGRFRTLDAAASWLLDEARRHYPDAIPGTA
jgi:hypothetical protein